MRKVNTAPPANRHERRVVVHADRKELVEDASDLDSVRGDRFLSRAAVCSKTGLSFPYVWKMIREGKFPAGREVGSRTLWLESEVDRWMVARPVRAYRRPEVA
ncbi:MULTISPECIES: helix-turn-helix transcriptional regulator [unclassified Bradyrhizobium]|uniref:helix-turn-helix transcriptional regulator n=1 Tax=unclassified Bradyrhizobium TaxID=2631580 RepID=UPI0028E22ECE|nr:MULTISPECIES: AlpA family phage regulatory protein [unclassified Bradyrhizobium]